MMYYIVNLDVRIKNITWVTYVASIVNIRQTVTVYAQKYHMIRSLSVLF